jgi:hypothetical protein
MCVRWGVAAQAPKPCGLCWFRTTESQQQILSVGELMFGQEQEPFGLGDRYDSLIGQAARTLRQDV